MKNKNELISALNKFRAENNKKEFEREEILSELNKMGFNKVESQKILTSNIFEVRKNKTKKYWRFKESPIHISMLESIKTKRTVVNEDFCIKVLQEKGYIIKKPIGLDIERLKKDGLYSKYMLYKIL